MSRLSSWPYTWEMFDEDVKSIITCVDFSIYSRIVGVASGGLPLLTALNNKIKLPWDIVRCVSYNGTRQEELHSYFAHFHAGTKDGMVLIVDDVADSGQTLDVVSRGIKKHGEEVETLTLMYKPQSKHTPTFYVREVPDDVWIIFPWE